MSFVGQHYRIKVNEWGGHDYESGQFIVRTTIENLERIVYLVSTNGAHLWHVTCGIGTPSGMAKDVRKMALERIGLGDLSIPEDRW